MDGNKPQWQSNPHEPGRRLQAEPTLIQKLPKGAEGGHEFSRIVDLLLFHDARRKKEKFTPFNDAAGDYHGLDSYGGDAFRKEGTTGYQYKFYPSPLSAAHRKSIEESLFRSEAWRQRTRLKRWILVTPEDLMEAKGKKKIGDVSWFEGLREKFNLKFQLEYWGHTVLQELFRATPSICLYYYPGLLPGGVARKQNLGVIRKRYDENMALRYRDIELVGMSVYKEEAGRGVPMENIYIPLRAVREGTDARAEDAARIDPVTFLRPGARSVVLGDPGSGKTTMMRFLSLLGQLEGLRNRYGSEADDRLPVLITLRRYADEMKKKDTLSLIDYIGECIRGDFTLPEADRDFFLYYLENGKGLLLFDGLDELPNPKFKKEISHRIVSLLNNYPGNTAVVTSRIVGYDGAFRLDDRQFPHYRLAGLRLPEMEVFVRDWYRVRIDSPRYRDVNAEDLIAILRSDGHAAIRELAQNPLLLTIITLVHRIDAVLPDERVVLYEKCTETLLNTWHAWKYRGTEWEHAGRVKGEERRSRKRMEAVAFWMQCRRSGAGKNQQSMATYGDIKDFLANYIEENEKYRSREEDPEDTAEEFLGFVKSRAGLLIEVGDGRYMFVHLTFQEYLAAAYIERMGKKGGIKEIWKYVNKYRRDAGWLEVIRLLTAKLDDDEIQESVIERLLAEDRIARHLMNGRLLGGLVLDGIEAAEFHKQEIFERLFIAAAAAETKNQLDLVLDILRACLGRGGDSEEKMQKAFAVVWRDSMEKVKMPLLLTGCLLNWPEDIIRKLSGDCLGQPDENIAWYCFFFTSNKKSNIVNEISPSLEKLSLLRDILLLYSQNTSFTAATFQSVDALKGDNYYANTSFKNVLMVLTGGALLRPFRLFYLNLLCIAYPEESISINLNLILDRSLPRVLDQAQSLDKVLDQVRVLVRARARALDMARGLDSTRAQALDQALDLDRDLTLFLDREGNLESFWQTIQSKSELHGTILDVLCDVLLLTPRVHWREALRTAFLPRVPRLLAYPFQETTIQKTVAALAEGNADDTDIHWAAFHLLFDVWLYIHENHDTLKDSPFKKLAGLTAEVDAPPLRIAHCIRDIAYGDKGRIADLKAMVESEDPAYRDIFVECLWRD